MPTSNESLLILLPIVWAIVAALIALALYRSSKGVLEGLDIPGVPAKGLRLTGSAVIFVVVFLLLQHATPGDVVVVPGAKFAAIRDSASELDNATLELAGCSQIDDTLSMCQQQVKKVRSEAQKIRELLAEEDPSTAGSE